MYDKKESYELNSNLNPYTRDDLIKSDNSDNVLIFKNSYTKDKVFKILKSERNDERKKVLTINFRDKHGYNYTNFRMKNPNPTIDVDILRMNYVSDEKDMLEIYKCLKPKNNMEIHYNHISNNIKFPDNFKCRNLTIHFDYVFTSTLEYFHEVVCDSTNLTLVTYFEADYITLRDNYSELKNMIVNNKNMKSITIKNISDISKNNPEEIIITL